MTRKYVFWDMDGTLFPFDPNATEDQLYSRSHYRDMLPVSRIWIQMRELMHNPNQEHFILTKYLNEEAKLGKDDALDKMHFPKERRLYVPYEQGKAQFAKGFLKRKLGKDCILLDDHTPNLIDWSMAGGCAIKVLNDINNKGGTWKGLKLSREGKIIPAQILSDNPNVVDDFIYAICRQALVDLETIDNGKTVPGETSDSVRRFFKNTGYVNGELILEAYDKAKASVG